MKNIINQYKTEIISNFTENKTSALKIKDYLEHSSVAYHGRCVHTLHIPKIFTGEVISYYEKITAATFAIFEKVIHEYINNPEYRKHFPFSKELEELILIPNQYASVLPIARFDIFFNEEDWSFKFCEINTDGTSAMNEDYVLNMAIGHNAAHQKMKQKYQFHTFELFDTWVDTLIELYETYENKSKARPYIAIVDFLEHCSITEFQEFKHRFEQKGYTAEICEITQLKYRDGILYSPQGHKIDVVYRRAVTSDIMNHYHQVQDFLNAVKEQKVCTIGSFCTQIIHNKWLFKILHEEVTLQFMNPEEQRFIKDHIPATHLLDSQGDLAAVKKDKDRWIIKPLDSYASKGVFAGTDYTQSKWEELVDTYLNQDYIYQEYCPPFRTPNIYLAGEAADWKEYTNMSGIFVYNGVMAGIYSRLSDGGIISSQYNEKAVATLYLQD